MTDLATPSPGRSSRRTQYGRQRRPGPSASLVDPARLPRWPVTALFVGFPLWWALGVVDLVWIPVAAAMVGLLATTRGARVPKGSGWWVAFLLWSGASALLLEQQRDLGLFGYRWLIYLSCGVLFVYVYNARTSLRARYVCGCLTTWFAFTAVGGYLGVAFPTAVLRTPMSSLVPRGILDNDLINHMVIRRMAQFNPDSFLGVAPRPSAPFLYTNNWGNVYSLLLPFVVAYLWQVRGQRRWWLVLAVVAASTVPAVLTLNRGMFLGIGLSMAYVAYRQLRAGSWKVLVAMLGLGLAAIVLVQVLPVQERLDQRLDTGATSNSNTTRLSLYQQSLERVRESPVFGFGSPQENADPSAVPVGTQGQVWMLLVSHGPVATASWIVFFLLALRRAHRRTDPVGVASGAVLLVGSVELLYYGFIPYGLPIMMVAAALGSRGPDDEPSTPAGSDPAARREPMPWTRR